MNLNKILKAVEALVLSSSEFMQEESKKFSTEDITYKGLNNLVSYVDQEMEKILVEGLKKILPEAGFITEEGTVEQITNKENPYWLIDPLDGTANFLHRIPQ